MDYTTAYVYHIIRSQVWTEDDNCIDSTTHRARFCTVAVGVNY